jgi:hypothetical protein
MKKVYILFAFLGLAILANAQSTATFNYQLVVRDNLGYQLADKIVHFRLSIIKESPDGTVVYSESQNETTNQLGVVTLQIGGGSPLTGSMASVEWGKFDYYLRTEIDTSGVMPLTYDTLGTSKFQYVPLSVYAITADKINGMPVSASPVPTSGQVLKWDGTAWKAANETGTTYSAGTGININNNVISNTAPDQTVSLGNGTGISVSGTYPSFTVANSAPNATHTGDATGSDQLTVVKINGMPVSNSPAPTNGQVLKWDGSSGSWKSSNESGGSYTPGTGISIVGNLISNTLPDQTVTMASGTGISIAGSYPSYTVTNSSPNATHTGDISGATAISVDKIKGMSVSATPAPTNGQVLKWDGTNTYWKASDLGALALTGGTLTGKLITVASAASSAGLNLPHGTSPTTPVNGDIWSTTGGLYAQINGTTVGPYTSNLGTVTSVGTAAPLSGGPITSSGTISIPQANASTDGYLFKTDWSNFNSKLSSSLTSGNIFVGNASNVATGVSMSGDAQISNTGYLTLANSGVTVGSYGSSGANVPNITVDAKGRLTAASNRALTAADVGAIQNQNSTPQSATYDITSSSSVTAKATSASSTGTGIVGVGNNVSASLYSNGCGGQFFGSKYGLYVSSTNTTGDRYAGYFSQGSIYAYICGTSSGGTSYKLLSNGSTSSSIVDKPDGGKAIMFSPEAPEILIQDYGTGKLQAGKCHITMDPVFSNNIIVSETFPLKVFIQLEGDCKGVYVVNKTKNGFDVIELQGGQSDVPFTWSVVANRTDTKDAKGEVISRHIGVRFPIAPGPLESK